ncbi:MAG: histidine--tRNA ligase [Bacteroidales bacterium]|jgi:histidyl-tRNA synthetase|nr:histidine--tRNA ligase [Bacteroidales bacterium]
MAQKPTIPKGTRDFIPATMIKRSYIFDTIRSVFQLHGYLPIETPAMETMETLMGKYGEEGDRLIFKILNSGDFHTNITSKNLAEDSAAQLANKLCEKALRYDLTVPFARFVVQNQNNIKFPFKRYQIQPVWRADRPQKGRYREFYQCDADIIGSNSLMNEVELVQIIDAVYAKLGIAAILKINNRKILTGIAEVIGEPDKIIDITVAIDKLDKIGIENVRKELIDKGLSNESITKLEPIIQLDGSIQEKIDSLSTILKSSEIGMKGIEEISYIISIIDSLPKTIEIDFDISLARGLNYYTGAIFEVKARDVEMGSICGGGRYDDLTGVFGLPHVSGVGISFGADRIYDVLEQLDLFPQNITETTNVLFLNFGDTEAKLSMQYLIKLREHTISCELYPEPAKIKKQMQYANDRNIPFVAILGEEEIASHKITLKNMKTGEQYSIKNNELISNIQNHLSQ